MLHQTHPLVLALAGFKREQVTTLRRGSDRRVRSTGVGDAEQTGVVIDVKHLVEGATRKGTPCYNPLRRL
jgi:hypothetical protein